MLSNKEFEINKIYNENCLDTMARIPDNFIDLTVTSPPYDDIRLYNGYTFDFESIAKELYRVTKKGGVIVWVVGDQTVNGSKTGTSFKQALYFKELSFNLHDTMIYKKTGLTAPTRYTYYPIFDFMFIFSKGKPKAINLIQDRKNKHAGAKIARKVGTRKKDGSMRIHKSIPNKRIKEVGIRFNIWEITSSRNCEDQNSHPAVFPESLARDHIISWSNESELVYDPFMGSGTTAKMALQNKRNYIGSEISKEYCQIAEKRLGKKINMEKNIKLATKNSQKNLFENYF